MSLAKIKSYAVKAAQTCCVATGFLVVGGLLIAGLTGIISCGVLGALFYGATASFFAYFLGGAAGALYGMVAPEKKPAPPAPRDCACEPGQRGATEPAVEQQQSQTTFRDRVTASRAQNAQAAPSH